MTMRTLGNEKGASLIMAVATLLILSLMAITVVSLVGRETFSALNQTQSFQAFDLTELGAHRAITYLGLEAGICTDITGASEFTDVAMGRGTFTVTAIHYNPTSTTLSADIDASVTTIPVVSTANFAPHGRIHIGYLAPVIDGTPSSASSGSSPITVANHSVGSGNGRLLMVGISQGEKNLRAVTSVTYGGTPLTVIGTAQFDDKFRVNMYYLLNPPTGTADVVVTLSGTPEQAVVGVASFKEVNQTTPFGPFVSNDAEPSPATVDVTSASNELVFDTVAARPGSTVGAGQTELWNINSGGGDPVRGGGSTEPGAGTVTMSWSINEKWAIGAVSIKPKAAEDVNYVDKTGTTFTGALRGVNGTTAGSHLSGIIVTQDLCLIRSTGTVTGPSGPAQRVVEVGVEYP